MADGIACGGTAGGDDGWLLRPATPTWLAGMWRSGDTVRAVLAGRLRLAHYDPLRLLLDDAVAEMPARIEVDLSEVRLMHPAVVGALVCAQRAASAASCRLVVTGAHARTAGLLRRLSLWDELTDPPRHVAGGTG